MDASKQLPLQRSLLDKQHCLALSTNASIPGPNSHRTEPAAAHQSEEKRANFRLSLQSNLTMADGTWTLSCCGLQIAQARLQHEFAMYSVRGRCCGSAASLSCGRNRPEFAVQTMDRVQLQKTISNLLEFDAACAELEDEEAGTQQSLSRRPDDAW
jgi:hypothetical protein